MDHGLIDKEGRWRSSHLAQIVRTAASVMAGLLIVIAIIAVSRRCAGAFQTPLSFQTLLCVGVVAIGPTFAIRQWWRQVTSSQHISSFEMVWALCTPTLSLLAIFFAISVSGTSALGLVLVGLLWGSGEFVVYRSPRRSGYAEATAKTMSIFEATHTEATDAEEPASEVASLCGGVVSDIDIEADLEAELEPHISQQLTRCRTEAGQDCLKGWVRVDVPTGHRSQNVHLAFCPAFEHPPEIKVHSDEGGPSCRIKMVQRLPYGVHFEVKLPKASTKDETLVLRFNAVAETVAS